MKLIPYWIILSLIFSSLSLKGQKFEIPIYFEDSIGNSDTIVLGYDILGGYEIDAALGEIDLIDSAYTKDFEVRASIYEYNDDIREEDTRIIESKKMIIGHVCEDPTYFGENNAIMAVIKCDHWPITIRWESSLFQEECNFMRIVDCTPGGWFDVCGGGHPFLKLEMPEIDSAQYFDTEYKIKMEEDTLSVLFFHFLNRLDLNTFDVSAEKRIVPYPNPVYDKVEFKFENDLDFEPNRKVSIYNMMGNKIAESNLEEEMDTQSWESGIYLYEIKEASKVVQVGRILVIK